ncbi:MAG: glycosyltransferase [Verrucomicrobiota bacterium]|nr:glycosyltransferase [Verrucomicrobiota bacterium]
MSALEWSFHALVLAGLLGALVTVLANLACFDGLRPAPGWAPDAPRVSILVPARNEAHNLERCVRSLLSQDYPNWELIVLDDHSSDGTAEIARGLGLSETGQRARLLRGAPLPEGWVGKNWACHQLARAANGSYLFFTDADTEHAPGTVSAAAAYAARNRADLLSAWPRLITETWSEKLVLPMILLLGMVLYPHWLVQVCQWAPRLSARLPRSWRRALGAANGQFLFFRREAYDHIGGHAAVRDHLVEDVALGRAIAARMNEGRRLLNCDALQFSRCRMYRNLAEVWEGFTKNIWAAFEQSLAGFVVVGVFQAVCFLLPCVLLVLGGITNPMIVAQVTLIYLIRLLLTLRFRTAWLSWALHPVGETIALAIGLHSWLRSRGGGVRWKGRTYQVASRS